MCIISYIGERQWQESATSLFPQKKIETSTIYPSPASEKNLTNWECPFWEESRRWNQLMKKFLNVYTTERSLPWSRLLTSGSYPEPHESSVGIQF